MVRNKKKSVGTVTMDVEDVNPAFGAKSILVRIECNRKVLDAAGACKFYTKQLNVGPLVLGYDVPRKTNNDRLFESKTGIGATSTLLV